jgi:hypothetical protein
MTLIIDIQHNSIECHLAECRDYLNVILSASLLNVIMLNAVMLNVVMLNVVMMSVVRLNVVRLNVVMLNVIAPGGVCLLGLILPMLTTFDNAI